MNKAGNISKIQHFSLGDGPGIRTTVFFQGCNLKCPWCHNPETISGKNSLLCYRTKCTLCGLCAKLCPEKAISFVQGRRIVDTERCSGCGTCEKMCPAQALTLSGRVMTQEEVFREIMKDYEFYEPSGGGVTFSGGEPLLQADFVAGLLERCREKKIHTIVDTAGCVAYGQFEKVLSHTDMFYFDLKASSGEKFLKVCGGEFETVLSNLKKLVPSGKVTVRMPVIPGYNDQPEDMIRCAKLLAGCGVKRADLIPFHRMGSSKYQALGVDYAYDSAKPPEESKMKQFAELIKEYGIDCRLEK